jgi:pyruvate,orthophosphate dikinase
METTVGTGSALARLDGSLVLGKELLGGKAWGINRMRSLSLPVPPAFTATVDCCRAYYEAGRTLDERTWESIVAGIGWLEAQTGRKFGGAERPLLVSVRSGAAISMPGMMDTVLNLGMNDTVEAALAASSAGPRYAADTRDRFVRQYTSVVLDGGGEVPGDPWVQLRAAVAAVFDSWMSPRAMTYRKNRGLTDDAGTAVTIQAMVFGNLDDRSGTGVLFTRNPMTGELPAFGEWLPGGQGEDVVSGSHDPLRLDALAEHLPEAHADLIRYADQLETLQRDIQDIEFTVESGKLWILQVRSAKRYARAAVVAAVTMVDENLITRREALRRVDAEQVRQLLKPELEALSGTPLLRGEPACPGFASGIVVADPDEAEERGDTEKVILARPTTSPDDLHGMLGAQAILTELGGSTSHAAVVSREIHRPCIVGIGAGRVAELIGKTVTVDGARGEVWEGIVPLRPVTEGEVHEFSRLFRWAAPLVPFRVRLDHEELPPDVVDLDRAADWRAALIGAQSVRGDVVSTEEGIRAIIDAGVREVIAPGALPVLLIALKILDDGQG